MFMMVFVLYVHFLQATLNWGKKDEPVYIIEEKGVVGLNFHQSKEAQLQDHANGYYDVSCLHFFFFSLQLFTTS